jgi:hypothetical protein
MLDKILSRLLTLLTLILVGCSDNVSINDDQTFATNIIVGSWTISETETYDLVELGDYPKITFSNNNAFLTHENNMTENYNWTIAYDTLTLLSASSPTISTLPFFTKSKYKMDIAKEDEFILLTLSPDKHIHHILRRPNE